MMCKISIARRRFNALPWRSEGLSVPERFPLMRSPCQWPVMAPVRCQQRKTTIDVRYVACRTHPTNKRQPPQPRVRGQVAPFRRPSSSGSCYPCAGENSTGVIVVRTQYHHPRHDFYMQLPLVSYASAQGFHKHSPKS